MSAGVLKWEQQKGKHFFADPEYAMIRLAPLDNIGKFSHIYGPRTWPYLDLILFL